MTLKVVSDTSVTEELADIYYFGWFNTIKHPRHVRKISALKNTELLFKMVNIVAPK